MDKTPFRTVSSTDKRFTNLDDNQWAYLQRIIAQAEADANTNGSPIVSVRTALGQETVYTAIMRIASSTSRTPVNIYERVSTTDRRVASEHPLHRVLTIQANPYMTADRWKHLTACHIQGSGNAFSLIVRDGKGNITELRPLLPQDVKIESMMGDGRLVYSWTNKNSQRFLFYQDEILHIRGGMSLDGGLTGASPIMQLRALIGRVMAREEFTSQFYRNNAFLGGVIAFKDDLTEEQVKRTRESFERLYTGPRNSGKMLVLEGGAEFNPLGIAPRDAEMLATAKFDGGSVAAAFGIPLQFINNIETTTRASAEQLHAEYLSLCLDPMFANIESQMIVSLLTTEEQAKYYVEFNRESLVQTDFAAKIDGMSKQIMSGMITINESRANLNLPSKPGGDSIIVPVNFTTLDKLGQAPTVPAVVPAKPEETAPPAEPVRMIEAPQTRATTRATHKRSRQALRRSAKPLLQDAFVRIGKREHDQISAAARRHLRDGKSFDDFLDTYYAEDSAFGKHFSATLSPIVRAMSGSVQNQAESQLDTTIDTDPTNFQDDYVTGLKNRYSASSRRQLQGLLTDLPKGVDPDDAVDERLDEWNNGTSSVNPTRAEKESDNESVRMIEALARFFFVAGGVTKLTWSGGDCPICQELDGKTVGIEENFVSDGEELANGYKADGDFLHAPLHQGCNCSVDPA